MIDKIGEMEGDAASSEEKAKGIWQSARARELIANHVGRSGKWMKK